MIDDAGTMIKAGRRAWVGGPMLQRHRCLAPS
jgi:hypothetical protein